MKTIIALIAFALVLAVPSMTFAAKGGGGYRGKVSKVDDKSITVDNKKSGDSKTFTIDASTKVTVDGAEGKISDVQVGSNVSVTAGDKPDTAASIDVVTKKKAK